MCVQPRHDANLIQRHDLVVRVLERNGCDVRALDQHRRAGLGAADGVDRDHRDVGARVEGDRRPADVRAKDIVGELHVIQKSGL